MSATDGLHPLMKRNFLEYASYVVVDRAIPDLRDGLKPVQRRILHTLQTMDDGKFIKVANVIGETMKLHPHGDASIGDALVVIANKGRCPDDADLGYFIHRQGNFGNELTGDNAAAARYIECRLTPLAREVLFNPKLTSYAPSYDGRKDEPVALPAKLPVLLLLGTEGIAVGMATTILPHNLGELIQAEIKALKGEKFKLLPDFPQGGLMDASEYDDGRGRVKLRAKIVPDGDKKIVIRELPFGTNTETLMASIETATEKGKVKISGISDRTGETVEIELSLPRGTYADEVIPQLFAYTDCETSVNSNIVLIRDRKPAELPVSEIVRLHAEQLKDTIRRELELEIAELSEKKHFLSLERIFIENRIYKRIEDKTTEEAVRTAVVNGLAPFKAQFVRELTDADIDRLLEIRIKRISQFDIDKNRKELDEVAAAIKAAQAKLKNLVATAIAWLEHIFEKYGKLFPRRTKVRSMEDIDKKAVANANITVAYDPESGFFGTAVKGERQLKVTEYDRILIITQDGMYKIVAPVEKTLIEGKLLHLAIFDPEKGLELTVLYKDKEKLVWAKRCSIQGFIKDREYELIKDRAGKIEWLHTDGAPKGTVTCHFAPAKYQRVSESTFDLATLEPCGLGARGTRIADKPTQKVAVAKPA